MPRDKALAPDVPPAVYLLADHLDTILAVGEDLAKERLDIVVPKGRVGADALQQSMAERRAFITRVQTLEASLIGRVVQARKHAANLRRLDVRFKMITSLFEAATVALMDAVEALGDPASDDFFAGGDAIAYLRSRGLIREDAAGLGTTTELVIGDAFLVAGLASLGEVLDMTARFLDILELHFELFDAGVSDGEEASTGLAAQ